MIYHESPVLLSMVEEDQDGIRLENVCLQFERINDLLLADIE